MEEKQILIKCPECGNLSDSIKQYTLNEKRIFIGVYTWWTEAQYTCCPHCMKKHILKSTFSWNIITGNILWLLDMIFNLLHLFANMTKGHSKKVLQSHVEYQVSKLIADLRVKIEKEVPEVGDFKPVFVEFENTDKTLYVTYFRLKVTLNPNKNDDGSNLYFLDFAGYRKGSPYFCEICVGAGTKQQILDALSVSTLPERLIKLMPRISDDLNYE